MECHKGFERCSVKKRPYLGGLGGGNSNMLKNVHPELFGEDVHPFWRRAY